MDQPVLPGAEGALGDNDATEVSVQLAELVTRLAWRIRRSQAMAATPLGLTFAQVRLLALIAGSSGVPKMADLARHLEIVPRALTDLVDGLEARGMVVRETDSADRRSTRLSITEPGWEALRHMEGERTQALRSMFASVTIAEQRHVCRTLGKVHSSGGCRVSSKLTSDLVVRP